MENGAVLCRGCHDYIEELSEEEREIANKKLREYKKFKECEIVLVEELEKPFKVAPVEISINERGEINKEKFNRAKVKSETRKLIEEEYRC